MSETPETPPFVMPPTIKLPPALKVFGDFLNILGDPEKYGSLIQGLRSESQRLEFIVSKVGKAQEIDGLHTLAQNERDEAEDMLAKAKKIAGEHKNAAEEARTTIIQKASAEAAQMRSATEDHCDALRTRTQNFVDEAKDNMKKAVSDLEERSAKIDTQEIRVRAEIDKLAVDRKALDAEAAALKTRLDGLNQALAQTAGK